MCDPQGPAPSAWSFIRPAGEGSPGMAWPCRGQGDSMATVEVGDPSRPAWTPRSTTGVPVSQHLLDRRTQLQPQRRECLVTQSGPGCRSHRPPLQRSRLQPTCSGSRSTVGLPWSGGREQRPTPPARSLGTVMSRGTGVERTEAPSPAHVPPATTSAWARPPGPESGCRPGHRRPRHGLRCRC
jgi:hypothetical protein